VTAHVDPVGTDPLAMTRRVAEWLGCLYVGGFEDGSDCVCEAWYDAQTAVRVLQPLIDIKVAEAVREALDELIEAHTETFGPAGSASRMWLRERRAALEQS
jgi:hypothetical protein